MQEARSVKRQKIDAQRRKSIKRNEQVAAVALFSGKDAKSKKARDLAEMTAQRVRRENYVDLFKRIDMELVFQPKMEYRTRDVTPGRVEALVTKMLDNRFTQTTPLVLQILVLPEGKDYKGYDPEEDIKYEPITKDVAKDILHGGFEGTDVHDLAPPIQDPARSFNSRGVPLPLGGSVLPFQPKRCLVR